MSATSTAEQRLQSWPWRLGHSVWTLWAFLGFGMFAWIGFAYIGFRARSLRWAIEAVVWLVMLAVILSLTPGKDQAAPGWYIALVLGSWALSTLQTVRALPAWWAWIAEQPGATWNLPKALTAASASAAASAPAASAPAASAPAASAPAADTNNAAPPGLTRQAPTPPTHQASRAVTAQRVSSDAAAVHRMPLGIGSVIPGLGVIDGQPEDGHGSFGTVYRIRRDFDGKHVAGKVFRPQPGLHGNQEAERALRDEMAALEQLQHPNIVRVMNPVQVGAQGSWMLVSEWVDGTTLELATLGIVPMSDEWVFHVGRQLLDALVYLESVGVVHRDIKPTNVMIDSAGVVKLIDFNLTRIAGRETAVAGTKPYLPPDHLLDGNAAVDALVDRFAMGVVLFELLTRKHPYVEYEHAAAPVLPASVPADPRAFRPDLSRDLAAFLTRSVQPREANRFASAAEMRAAWLAATNSTVGFVQSTPESTTSAADPNDEAAATA